MPDDLLGIVLNPGALIVPSGRPGVQGDRGAEGAEGPDGPGAWTRVVTSFTPPAANGTVQVTVNSTEWMAAGAALLIAGEVYEIVSVDSATQVTLRLPESGFTVNITGIGRFVLQHLPVINQPTINQPRLIGVTDGSDAAPGEVGEYIVARRDDLATFCNGSWYHVTGLTLSPGDWDVQAQAYTIVGSGNLENFAIVMDEGTSGGDGWGLNGPIFLERGAQLNGTSMMNNSLTTPVARWVTTVPTTCNLLWLCMAPGASHSRVVIRARRVR